MEIISQFVFLFFIRIAFKCFCHKKYWINFFSVFDNFKMMKLKILKFLKSTPHAVAKWEDSHANKEKQTRKKERLDSY